MEGTFAKVYKGTVLERDGSEEKVVVKTVIGKSVKFLVIHNTAQLLCGIPFESRNDSLPTTIILYFTAIEKNVSAKLTCAFSYHIAFPYYLHFTLKKFYSS